MTIAPSLAGTVLKFSCECCAIDGVVLRVTRDGVPLGSEEHATVLAAAREMSKVGSSDLFETAWLLQLGLLGLLEADCVVVLFEGTIAEESVGCSDEWVRKAHAVFRRRAFGKVPYWVPVSQMVPLVPPTHIKRRA